jgi:hypothetical protein
LFCGQTANDRARNTLKPQAFTPFTPAQPTRRNDALHEYRTRYRA